MRKPIPESLARFVSVDKLEHISATTLARSSTSVLQRMQETAQPFAIQIQGRNAMVNITLQQYEDIRRLLIRMVSDGAEDEVTQHLAKRFDELVAEMNAPGAMERANKALFDDPEQLAKNYRPGTTETQR